MHKGDTLGRKIEECFLEWGIGKIFTVPIDNASSKIGMKCIDTSITKIRSVVRYVRSSLERAKQFKRCVEKKKIVDKRYLMLRSAIKFEKALARFAKDNKKYLSHIGDPGLADASDWEHARNFIQILAPFSSTTV
jgi:hypothetical protein